jgi:hypothetical protein
VSIGSTTSDVTTRLECRCDGDDAVRQRLVAMRFPMLCTIALRLLNRPTLAFWRFWPHWPL